MDEQQKAARLVHCGSVNGPYRRKRASGSYLLVGALVTVAVVVVPFLASWLVHTLIP